MRYHQQYQREMKGMAGSATAAEGTLTRDYVDQCGQVCDQRTFWENGPLPWSVM